MAVQHLLAQGGTALSAGVNLMLAEHTTAATQVAGMLSAVGRCRTLDAAADGYVRAESCVALRLDAVSAGRTEGAAVVIRGTCVNQAWPLGNKAGKVDVCCVNGLDSLLKRCS